MRFVMTAALAGISSGTGVDSLESLDIFDMEVGVSGTERLNLSFHGISYRIAETLTLIGVLTLQR